MFFFFKFKTVPPLLLIASVFIVVICTGAKECIIALIYCDS